MRAVIADVGVAGRLGVVVGLGLDDQARAALVHDDAADQVARDLEHRAVVEAPGGGLLRAALQGRWWTGHPVGLTAAT